MGMDVLTAASPPSGSKTPRTRRVLIVVLVACIGAAGVSLAVWRVDFPPLAGYPVFSTHPVRVTLASGCPQNILGYSGVRNTRNRQLRRFLVPGSPVSGLVCHYFPGGGAENAPYIHGALYRAVAFDRSSAGRLANELRALKVNPKLRGPLFGCNNIARYDVLVFHYSAGSDVDLWLSSTGCPIINNGVMTPGIGAEGFATFEGDLDSLAPPINLFR